MEANPLQIPDVVTYWIKEMRNPKTSQFQRDLYRSRIEALVGHLQEQLNDGRFSPPRK